ncbi:MAG: serpin family protein [Tangfeifania sp.]
MKTIILLLLAFVLTSISSCQKNEVQPPENKIIDLDEKSARLIEADNEFGLEMFQKVREESDEENLMISPLSISVALAMAYNGADGDTKTEMEETMKLNGLTTDEINASYKMLIKALQSLDEDVVFEIANAIFYADIMEVKPGFLDVNKNVYEAEVDRLNFSSPSAVETINNWVAGKTNDKITEIIERLDPLDRMVLLNAIYFNGTWSNDFDKKGTHELAFHKTDGSTIEVPMMSKMEKLDYTANSLFKAIKMPYGNGQYNMVVFLPAGENNSQDVIDELSAANWKKWMNEFEMTDRVDITMPRFKFEFEAGLNDLLKKMGMKKAFVPDVADFSKISDVELYISAVKHKSFIDVNETGTEAAAVTSITFTTTSAGNEPPTVPFFVNKPFVFAITENDTDAILFMGEVQNPEYDE